MVHCGDLCQHARHLQLLEMNLRDDRVVNAESMVSVKLLPTWISFVGEHNRVVPPLQAVGGEKQLARTVPSTTMHLTGRMSDNRQVRECDPVHCGSYTTTEPSSVDFLLSMISALFSQITQLIVFDSPHLSH